MSHPRLRGLTDDPDFDKEIECAENITMYVYISMIIVGGISFFSPYLSA